MLQKVLGAVLMAVPVTTLSILVFSGPNETAMYVVLCGLLLSTVGSFCGGALLFSADNKKP